LIDQPIVSSSRRTLRSKLGSLTVWGLLLLGVAVLDVPLCPVAGLLGIPCPGCGMSRAGVALLRGQFSLAWQLHPLIFLVVPLLLGVVGAWLAPQMSRRQTATAPPGKLAAILASGLLILVLSVYIARFLGAFGGPVEVETYAQWLGRVRSALTP
jgi:hypothetical protein